MSKRIARWKVGPEGWRKVGAKEVEAGSGKTHSIVVVEALSREGLEVGLTGLEEGVDGTWRPRKMKEFT